MDIPPPFTSMPPSPFKKDDSVVVLSYGRPAPGKVIRGNYVLDEWVYLVKVNAGPINLYREEEVYRLDNRGMGKVLAT